MMRKNKPPLTLVVADTVNKEKLEILKETHSPDFSPQNDFPGWASDKARSSGLNDGVLSSTPIPIENIEKNNREVIEETYSELLMIQGKIRDFMLTSDVSEEELEHDDEEVLQHTLRYKRKYKKCVAFVEPKVVTSGSTTSEVSFAFNSHHITVKLPKIELRKLTGEIKYWLGWWAQFNKIHVDSTLEDSDKFQYLVQSMSPGTRA
ncbi:hypothetical protein LAZ67_X004356 [Cordylochernes scorpioides]|uniref:Uncharacterized protein n=1 Tax=Cordylochernes scorpioides TaxID=51811 RepID=A0ABY6LY70_9ARAC|nr:hypothetical protein LAZ67_X004356 [Cordylochernes scorpioides]